MLSFSQKIDFVHDEHALLWEGIAERFLTLSWPFFQFALVASQYIYIFFAPAFLLLDRSQQQQTQPNRQTPQRTRLLRTIDIFSISSSIHFSHDPPYHSLYWYFCTSTFFFLAARNGSGHTPSRSFWAAGSHF